MRFKAVFFDAGETLVHPSPSFAELFAKTVSEAGFPVNADVVHERLPIVSRRFRDAADAREGWSTDPERSRAFWLDVYRLFLVDVGIPTGGGLDERLYEVFSDHRNYALFDDVEPSLEALSVAGVTMGVVSNFEDWLEVLLDRLNVTQFFPVRVISGIEGIEKPDPAIFRLALERSGHVPEDCAYVGDNPHFDVEPAAAVGMFPILVDRRDRHPDPVGGARIRSLEELPALTGR